MNKLRFLPALAILLLLVINSCSNEDKKVDPNQPGAPASLTIQLKGTKQDQPMMKQRARLGEAAPANEDSIHNGVIMIFRGNTSTALLDGKGTFSNGVTNLTVACTQGMRYVYVVANTDLTRFNNVTKLGDLYNLASKATLSEVYATGMKGIFCPMSGSASVDASTATLTTPVNLAVTMQFVCNKINIDWILQLNPSMTGLQVDDAYLLNVKSASDYFVPTSSDLLTSNVTDYSEGLSNYGTFSAGTYYPVTPSTSSYDANLKIGSLSDQGFANNYFYAFDNGNNPNSPTEVVIQAHKGSTIYYYPIVINGPQNTSGGDGTYTIRHGRIYQVTATIKGAGNENPFEPISAASINVTIVPATWDTTLSIGQIFN